MSITTQPFFNTVHHHNRPNHQKKGSNGSLTSRSLANLTTTATATSAATGKMKFFICVYKLYFNLLLIYLLL
jgi:hypothetical protein